MSYSSLDSRIKITESPSHPRQAACVSRILFCYNIPTPNPGDNMTPQEYYNQINIILDIIKRCTTWDQLQVLSKQHGHITQIRYALNERACEIADGV